MSEKTTAEETKTAVQAAAEVPANIFDGVPDPVQSSGGTQQTQATASTETATTAAVPATATAADSAANTQSQPSPFLKALQEQYGFENLASEEEARDRLLQAYGMATQQQSQFEQQLNQLRQQNLVMQSQLQQAISPQQQVAAQQTQATAKEEDPWPQIPKIDFATEQAIRKFRTEEGGWKPETPPHIINTYLQFEAGVENWQRQLATNPQEALAPLIRHEAQKLIKEAFGGDPRQFIEQADQERSVQQQTQQMWQSVEPWMWQADPRTGAATNVPTQFGQVFRQTFDGERQRILSLAPSIDQERLFAEAMRGAYAIHARDVQAMQSQWDAYQQSQTAGGPTATQATAAATQVVPATEQVDPRAAARRQHLERANAPRNNRAGAQTRTDEGAVGKPKRNIMQSIQAASEDFGEQLAAAGVFG